ncbi:hypothetical protein FQA39_LY05980 [Lamprigera yunnana]|nr:hypothetical protein FQA39_LY05980 [Lamprigera yunnana]
MSEQKEEVKYFPVATDDQLYLQCQTNTMKETKNPSEISVYGNFFLYVAAITASISVLACGMALGWTSPVIPKLNGNIEPEKNPLPIPLTLEQASWIGSLLPLGAVFGPLAAGAFVDRIGRKKALVVSVVPLMVAFNLCVFISNVNLFYLIRFLCGLSIGGVFTVLPIYLSEISEKSNRGTLGSFLGLFIVIGILLSYVIGPYVSLKVFNIVCATVPAVFVPIFLKFIPESPHYLILRNDKEGAEKALASLRTNYSKDFIHKELMEIKETVEISTTQSEGSFTDLFMSRGLKRALLLSIGLVFFQQFSGINAVLFYTQTIFSATGSTIPPDVSTIIVGVVQAASSFLPSLLADKAGKRFLLLFSALGMGLSETILGLYFYLQGTLENVDFIFWLPIVSLMGYIISYNAGFGALPWAVMGEIFPSNIKSVASTVTVSVCWITAFLITYFYATISQLLGTFGSFWIFSGCCLSAFIFVFKLLPETSRKTFQEIQDILNAD